MSESNNIQIPTALFNKIILFFDFISLSNYEFPSFYNHRDIILELKRKQRSVNLRNTYTKFKQSMNDEQKRLAYADYLSLKRKKSE
jgi:predicted ABC-type exoprotein transport system permease subunit